MIEEKNLYSRILDLHLQISWNQSIYHWRDVKLYFVPPFRWLSLSKTTKINLLVSLHEEVCIDLNLFIICCSLSLSLFLSLFLFLSFFLFLFLKVLHLMQIYGRFRPCYHINSLIGLQDSWHFQSGFFVTVKVFRSYRKFQLKKLGKDYGVKRIHLYFLLMVINSVKNN